MLGYSLGEFVLGELDDEYVPPPPAPPVPPGSPVWTVADFLAAAQDLLPRGRAWTRDPLAVLTKLLTAVASAIQQLCARAAYLLVDAFPATTVELLPEWEESVGLPDPCAGEAPTIGQRRAEVLARLAFQGGQSVPFFKAYAAALGYPSIQIDEFSPTVNTPWLSGEPTPTTDVEWANTWQVRAPTVTVRYFQFGVDTFGEQFVTSDGGDVLKCEFARLKPAHTRLVFAPL